jgi:signal transduction histidine kinase
MLRSRPHPFDLLLTAGVVVFTQLEVWLEHLHPLWVSAPLTLAQALALLWRRSAPLASVLVLMGLLPVQVLAGVPLSEPVFPLLLTMLGLYGVAAHAALKRALLGLGLPLLAMWGTLADEVAKGKRSNGDVLFITVLTVAPWLVGRAMRGQVGETRRAERERAAAVVAERARIARELHDVIAHSVSVMVVQAGAAEQMLTFDPSRVREPLLAIQQTGRRALVEMTRLVGMLRQDGEELGLDPQPGLDDVDALIENVRQAGLEIDYSIDGSPKPLSLGADLSGYRVVQEALTNTLKHSPAARAAVSLRYTDEALEIEVRDEGSDAPGGAPSGGHGLAGLRERIAVFGGTFHAGPRPEGGFLVRARLPVERSA